MSQSTNNSNDSTTKGAGPAPNAASRLSDVDEDPELASIKTGSSGDAKLSREVSGGGNVNSTAGGGKMDRMDSQRLSTFSFHASDSRNQSITSLPSGSVRGGKNLMSPPSKNISNKDSGGSNSPQQQQHRDKIKREGSRLFLGDENKGGDDKDLAGETDVDNFCVRFCFGFFLKYMPWMIRKEDTGLERERRIGMIDALMFTSICSGLPLMIAFAISLDEHKNDLEATRIVTFFCFLLQFLLPFAFWIGINVKNDSDYADAVKRVQDQRKKEKIAANTAILLQNEMNKNDNTAQKPAAAAAAGAAGTPLGRANSQKFVVDVPRDEKTPIVVPRPPLDATAIDVMITLLMCLCVTVGICWRGISLVMLIILIRTYARSSRCGSVFMAQRVQFVLFLVGGLYLLVKGCQESFLIDQSKQNIAASTAFLNSQSSAEDIVAIVVGALNLFFFGFFCVMNNELNRINFEHLRDYALKRARDREGNLLTHAEQHVAGGLITALTKLEVAAARKLAERYITPSSPGILRSLNQLSASMETYLPFIPAWVRNPNAVNTSHGDDDAAELNEESEEDAENAELNQSSETWSSSHNDSTKSALGSKIFSGSMNASNGNLTKENVAKVGEGSVRKNDSNNNAGGGAEAGGADVFGEYNLEYSSDDDDIMSVKQEENNKDNKDNNVTSPNKKGGNANKKGGNGPTTPNTALNPNMGFSGKVVIATLQFSVDFKKYSKAKHTAGALAGGLFPLPNAIPDSSPPPPLNNNNNNINDRHDPTHSEVERAVVDRICDICSSSGGILHSIIANRVIVSWNTMVRIAAPEHKAARFLVTCRKLATDPNTLFPGLKITGACITGHGRAMVSNAGSMVTSVVCVRWFRELELLGILAAQEDALLCDMATKHAVFLEFSVRGFGCLGSVKSHQFGGAKQNHFNAPSMTPTPNALKREGPAGVRASALLKDKPISNNVNGSGNNNTNNTGDNQQQLLPTSPTTNADFFSIFSLIGRRTGNNVEWMYLLQGGDEDSGAADPAAVSCSAMDYAAAGNFKAAKKYVDQALRLSETEGVDLNKKRDDMMINGNISFTQRQKDEADALEEQIEINIQSTYMFKRLSARLDIATVENFPFKLVVV